MTNKKNCLDYRNNRSRWLYLAKFLLENYIVHGIKRRTSLFNTQRIDDIFEDSDDFTFIMVI